MGKKKNSRQILCFVTMLSFSAIILYPAGQWILLLFPVILLVICTLSGGSLFEKRVYLPICILSILSIGFYIIKIRNSTVFTLGCPQDCVTSIVGKVVYDSSFTKNSNHFMTLNAVRAGTIYNQQVSANGLVNIIGKEQNILTSGIKVKVYGKFSDGFFKASSIQVLQRNRVNDIREFLITEIEKRISKGQTTESSMLSTMLILGRADDCIPSLKELAVQCGCTHVLALSGMHLNFLTMVFKPIKNKKLEYVLTIFFASVFVFIAGPRPSLLRALFMLVFCFLPTDEKLIASFVFQCLFFPTSIANTGFLYSYLAIFALAFLAPLVKQSIPVFKFLSSSISVVCLIAPLEILSEEAWYPIAVLISPIAGLLIMVDMLCGFCLLIIGPHNLVVSLNNLACKITTEFFRFFSKIGSSGWKEYLVFLSFVLLLLLKIPFEKVLLRHRFKNNCKKTIME